MSYKLFAKVLVDSGFKKTLDYGVGNNILNSVHVGTRVSITLRNRLTNGTVIALSNKSNIKVLPIQKVLDPVFTKELFDLSLWVSKHYCTPLSKVLNYILLSRKKQKPKEDFDIVSTLSLEESIELSKKLRLKHPKQSDVLDLVNKGSISLKELYKQASKSSTKTLIDKGILKLKPHKSHLEIFEKREKKILTPEQISVVDKTCRSLKENKFNTILIQGVPGSGKTEIYLHAIRETLLLGKGVIFLVPEISLIPQMVDYIRGEIKEKIGLIHSRIKNKEYTKTWEGAYKGDITVVLGARSAIFTPVKNLGLIIVDEEHDTSYKQFDKSPVYHAREVAIYRGKLTQSTVLLGSATPSVESYYNGLQKKYSMYKLTTSAIGTKKPTVEIVDMSTDRNKKEIISQQLVSQIKKNIEKKEQTILLLNRRGFYTSRVCTSCFCPKKCNNCDCALTYHNKDQLLVCHICNAKDLPEPKCDICNSPTLKYKGIGTERLEQALRSRINGIKIVRMDLDTVSGNKHQALLEKFKKGEDVLIGTQMISKGLHLPVVTLVGILGIDSSLHIANYQSNEHTFNLISQVAGRSGRESPGKVIVQTRQPNHPTMILCQKNDYHNFYQQEIKIREQFCYPPFTKLAKIIFTGNVEEEVELFANNYRRKLLQIVSNKCELFPVTPCGHSFVKNRYKFQFLSKFSYFDEFSQSVRKLDQESKKIKVLVDVGPISTW